MVQSQSQSNAHRARGSSRVVLIIVLAIATTCLILSRSINLEPSHSLLHGSLLGNPFEPDSQDEQPINQPDHSERLQSYVYGLTGGSDGSGSKFSDGTSIDTRRDTDDVRQLRRSGDYAHPGGRRVRDDDDQRSGPSASGLVRKAVGPSENYNVNILNGRGSDVSSRLSYITSPIAGFGSDSVGGDITSSLNQNIRDIQKLQQQFSAPERARRRSKLLQLHKDDKMLQSRLLDTLKLQESQMIAETKAVKRLSLSLQQMRQHQQQELDQRATTSQLNELSFDLKRLAAIQKAEYKSLLHTKALPGPPGPPGPPGANGHNGLNGSPGSIQQLIPVPRHRLAAVPSGHWADEALFRRNSPTTGSSGLSFLSSSLPPAIPPPYEPFPNRIETLPNGAKYQTHWVSPDGQRSWDIHPPIPPPHRRCQDDDLSCNSQNNPNTWGSARKESDAVVRAGMRQALAQDRRRPTSPAHAASALQRAESPLALADPSSKRALADADQLHSQSAVAASRVASDDDRRLRSHEAGSLAREREEAPLALAAPSPAALAEAGQLNLPAAQAALRNVRVARQRLQAEQRPQQSLVGAAAVPKSESRPAVPALLNADLQERSRALGNARIVLPATLLRGQGRWDGAGAVKGSDASDYMRRTGLKQRLADAQRSQDNSGFFESPASVVDE